METTIESTTITPMGVLQSVRTYDYENNQVIIERQLDGKTIASETFYLD